MRVRRFLAVTGTAGAMILAAAGCNSAPKGWGSPDASVGSASQGSQGSQGTAKSSSSAKSSSGSNKGGASAPSSKSSGGAAASSSKSGGGAAAGGTSGSAEIPSNFPMPPGADVSKYGSSALIQVTDPQSAFSFWLSELPKAGYTITNKNSSGTGANLIASLDFEGNGVTGTLSLLGTVGALSLN